MSKGFKDLRSRIKHDNPQLGKGASLNSNPIPNNSSHSNLYPISSNQGFTGGSSSQSYSNSTSNSYNYSNPSNPSTDVSSLSPAISRDSPLRPARSVRRPQQAPAIVDPRNPSPSGLGFGLAPAIVPRSATPASSNHSRTTSNLNPTNGLNPNSRSAQMMNQTRNMPSSDHYQENDFDIGISPIDGPSNPSSAPPWSSQYNPSSSSNPHSDSRSRQSSNTPTSPTQGGLGSLTQPKEPAALNSVISALSAAGRKHQANRIMRGGVDVTAEEEKKRRRNERKIDDLRGKSSRPLKEYMRKEDERSFRGINGE